MTTFQSSARSPRARLTAKSWQSLFVASLVVSLAGCHFWEEVDPALEARDAATSDADVIEGDADGDSSDAAADADTGAADADAGDVDIGFAVANVRLQTSSGDARTVDDLLLSFEAGSEVSNVAVDWRTDGSPLAELILPMDRIDADSSVDYSHSGSTCSVPVDDRAPTESDGRIGQAYEFDGVDDAVRCDLDFDFSRPFSFEAWLYLREGDQPFANSGPVGAVDEEKRWSWQFRFGFPGEGFLGFYMQPEQGESVWLSAGKELDTQKWHHVVGTHDGSTARMYVDGELADSAAASRLVSVDYLRLGEEGWEQYFAGRIDGVRVFSRALSAAQVRAFYEAGLDGHDGRTMLADETRAGQTWSACVTPIGETDDGQTVCSNDVELEGDSTDPSGVPDDAQDVTQLGIKGDGSDETAAIQALLDDADPDDAFYFPATDDFYGIGAPGLVLKQPVRLYGDGWESGGAGRRRASVGTFSGSELRNVDPGGWSGIMVDVQTNGVLIDGLKMSGESYVGVDWAPNYLTRVLSVDTDANGRYENFTLRNCWLEGAESVLWIDYVDDFIIDNCHVEGGRQSLIYIKLAHRGMVRSTNYWDSGDPPVGGPAWKDGGNPTGKGYGLVVTTPRTQPERSSDMLIYDNWGKSIALWFADHNHGCHRYLSFNNLVEDSRYGFSGSALNTTDYERDTDQWYLNNTTRDMRLDMPAGFTSTGYAFTSGRYLDSFHMIGNIAMRTDGRAHRNETFRARGETGGRNGVVTWNEARGPASSPHMLASSTPEMACAHNTADGVPMEIDGGWDDISSRFSTPDAPTQLGANATAGGVELTWSYPEGRTHDSFFIQWSADGNSDWQRVAFTPPHNGIFDFDAPTNPHWERYNPLRWFDDAHQSGYYRIRANNGDKTSGWSNVAQVP